jgi:hypothetical protein
LRRSQNLGPAIGLKLGTCPAHDRSPPTLYFSALKRMNARSFNALGRERQ